MINYDELVVGGIYSLHIYVDKDGIGTMGPITIMCIDKILDILYVTALSDNLFKSMWPIYSDRKFSEKYHIHFTNMIFNRVNDNNLWIYRKSTHSYHHKIMKRIYKKILVDALCHNDFNHIIFKKIDRALARGEI